MAGVTGKDHDLVRCLEPVGIRFVFAVGRIGGRQMKMGILGGRHLDIRILIDQAGHYLVASEHVLHRSAKALIPTYFRVWSEILNYSRDDRLNAVGPVNVDGLLTTIVPFDRHQRA